MNETSKAAAIEIQKRDFTIFKFLRDHRALNNVQIQKAFWPDKNIRAVDFRLRKLANHDFIKHVKFENLQPSNYYFLARKGFNLLAEKGYALKGERLYRPENHNVSAFFQRRTLIADIRIALKLFYGKSLDVWFPDFEIEAQRYLVGLARSNQKTLAAVIPDALFALRTAEEGKNIKTVLCYHHFTSQREQFTKRLDLFEPVWSKFKKLIMANTEEQVLSLARWYRSDLRKRYAIDVNIGNVKWKDIYGKYSFAAYQTLMKTGELQELEWEE